MTEKEAVEIALKLVSKNLSEHYTLNFISINKSRVNSDHWAVAFEVRTKTGSLLEGPIFIMVNDNNSDAWFFG